MFTYEHPSVSWPADISCSLQDLLGVMDDRDGWQESQGILLLAWLDADDEFTIVSLVLQAQGYCIKAIVLLPFTDFLFNRMLV